MPITLIIADDLTGAADTGVQFAVHGWRTLLALEPSGTGAADILSMYADSRNLPSAELAGQATSQVIAALRAQNAYHELLPGFRLVYKKMDSTLRGYPAAELAALLSALGETRALIAPAFPAQGRTTLQGTQQLNGLPLEQTSFAGQFTTSNLLELFGSLSPALLPLNVIRQGQIAVGNVLRQAKGPLIADAETDADLKTLAQAALSGGLRVCCGSAGLAAALVESMAAPSATQPLRFVPQAGPILAVAGSLNPATSAQVAYAARQGCAVIQPSLALYGESYEPEIETVAGQVRAALGTGSPVILVTPTQRLASAPGLEPFAVRLARIAVKALAGPGSPPTQRGSTPAQRGQAPAQRGQAPGGLLLNGGDTARAVCQLTGCTRVWLGSQLEPGIPWGLMADGIYPGLPVVTKAGGFGREYSIYQALQFLQKGTL